MTFVLKTRDGRFYAGPGQFVRSEDHALKLELPRDDGEMRELLDSNRDVALAPEPHQPACRVCGRRGESGDSKCANCWEVERRLDEYVSTSNGLAFAESVLDEARTKFDRPVLNESQRRKLKFLLDQLEAAVAEQVEPRGSLAKAVTLVRVALEAAAEPAPARGS